MFRIRTTLRAFLLACALVISVAASGLTAHAHEPIGFSHAPGKATFTNPNSVTVSVNYGTANSDDVKHVKVPAGKSVTVTSTAKNFGYTATIDGTVVGQLQWPGVDLSAKREPSLPSTGN